MCVVWLWKFFPFSAREKEERHLDTGADHLASEHRTRDNQRESKKKKKQLRGMLFFMVVSEIEKCFKNLIEVCDLMEYNA